MPNHRKNILFCSVMVVSQIAFFCSGAFAVEANQATAAKNMYNQLIAPQVGSKESINRMGTAFTQGGSMTSLDGTRSFVLGGMQNSGTAALKITALPGSQGDISKIIVEQDLDGNGQIETVRNFPTPVDAGLMISGSCSNGYIACTPGTYENCKYRKWDAEESGAITVIPQQAINDLSNCYCFNNHCSSYNNTAFLNMDSLLSDFGGGIVSAFLSRKTDFVITSATAGPGTLSYNGSKITSPSGAAAKPATCYQPATPISCPSGYSISGSGLSCEAPANTANTPCSDGALLQGGNCVKSSTYSAKVTYACPDGKSLYGDQCKTPITYPATDVYCRTEDINGNPKVEGFPPGDHPTTILEGECADRCIYPDLSEKGWRCGGYPYEPARKTCPTGGFLIGDTCHTGMNLSPADTSYSCAAGDDLSGTVCTTTKSTPVIASTLCPAGGARKANSNICEAKATTFVCNNPDYPTLGTDGLCKIGNPANCPANPADSPALPPIVYTSQTPNVIQAYYNDIGPLDSIGQAEITAQQAQPNSLYNLVKGVANSQPGVQLKKCTVAHTTSIELKNHTFATSQISDSTKSDHYVCLTYDRVGETGLKIHLQTNNWSGGGPGTGCKNGNMVGFEQSRDLGTVYFVPDTPDYANGYELTQVEMKYKLVGSIPGQCSDMDESVTWFKGIGSFPMEIQTICNGPGEQNFVLTSSATFVYTAQEFVHSDQNSCAAFETDPTCRLKDEKWDGRDTVFNFMPTGFRMSQICKDITGPIRTTQFCRNWWKKERTYSCDNGLPPYTFDESRVQEAKNSATLTGDTMTYTEGGVTKSYVIGFPPPDLPCEQVCKTKMPEYNSEVSSSSNAIDVKTATSMAAAGFRFFYRTCIADAAGNNVCPVDPASGETIATDCACEDQRAFGEAMAGLSAISSIKKDSICSSVPAP